MTMTVAATRMTMQNPKVPVIFQQLCLGDSLRYGGFVSLVTELMRVPSVRILHLLLFACLSLSPPSLSCLLCLSPCLLLLCHSLSPPVSLVIELMRVPPCVFCSFCLSVSVSTFSLFPSLSVCLSVSYFSVCLSLSHPVSLVIELMKVPSVRILLLLPVCLSVCVSTISVSSFSVSYFSVCLSLSPPVSLVIELMRVPSVRTLFLLPVSPPSLSLCLILLSLSLPSMSVCLLLLSLSLFISSCLS